LQDVHHFASPPHKFSATERAKLAAALAKKIGGRIKDARGAAGMTQHELADKVHVEPITISRWERGVSIADVVILAELAQVLEMKLGDLIG
jgi:ribosome-binding protein aMBF1 (putative translation factor)